MAVGGVSQNTLLQTNNFSGNNSKPKPFNGGTVSVRTNANATQRDVLRTALLKFAYNAGIRDSAAREAFADRWISKMGGDSAKLYTNGKPIADKTFSGDKADGNVSVSIVPGEHDALIRDLRNVQVEQKVISFSEANFTPISKQPAKVETPMDSVLRSRYEESLVFDPSQMTRQNLEQKYRDGQYEKLAQDPSLSEMALDLTQMGLDIVGIFEPTPFADGANTVISALRGDWGNAALSALGIVPYVGDLAKFGKIPKWIASIKKISAVVDKLKDVVKMGGKAAEAAKGFVSEIRRLLDKIPFEKLPDSLKDAFKSLKQKVDDFVSWMKKGDNPADNVKNADKIDDAAKTADNVRTTKTGEATPKQPEIEPPNKPDLDKQKKLDELKAKRAEAESQRKLQEGIKDAEAKGKLQKIKDDNIDDYNWLQSNPRNKELAYDPDTKSFKVEEGKAALKAEQDGLLKPPVKRAIDENGRSRGGDYIDGTGKYWDVKNAAAGADEIVNAAKTGEDILVDARNLSEAEAKLLEQSIRARLPQNAGEVKIIKR